MDFILLIVIAPILYLLLGTVAGILVTVLKTDQLKFKIILIPVIRSGLYTLLLSLLLPTLFDFNWVMLVAFALAVFLKEFIFSKERVLSGVTIYGNNISLQYINMYLKTRQLILPLDSMSAFRLSSMRSMGYYPASFSFKANEKTEKFVILSKKVWDSIDEIPALGNAGQDGFALDQPDQAPPG